jgi:hypothetical protein
LRFSKKTDLEDLSIFYEINVRENRRGNKKMDNPEK